MQNKQNKQQVSELGDEVMHMREVMRLKVKGKNMGGVMVLAFKAKMASMAINGIKGQVQGEDERDTNEKLGEGNLTNS